MALVGWLLVCVGSQLHRSATVHAATVAPRSPVADPLRRRRLDRAGWPARRGDGLDHGVFGGHQGSSGDDNVWRPGGRGR